MSLASAEPTYVETIFGQVQTADAAGTSKMGLRMDARRPIQGGVSGDLQLSCSVAATRFSAVTCLHLMLHTLVWLKPKQFFRCYRLDTDLSQQNLENNISRTKRFLS